MTHARFRSPALLLAAAALTAAPALAQQQYDRQMDREEERYYQQEQTRSGRDQQVGGSWQYDQQQPRRGTTWQQTQRGTQGQQWQTRGQQQQAMRSGDWVRIAVDFDNDGNFDAYHTINRQELNQLRLGAAEMGRRGMGQQNRFTQQDRFQQDRYQQERFTRTPSRYEQDSFREWDEPGSEQQREFESRTWTESRWDDDRFDDRSDRQSRWGQSTSRQETVRGEIESLNTVRFSGMRDEHVLARVTTEDGRVHNVDLGPRRTLSNLDLNEGDSITLTAMRGQINQRPVLLATTVQAGGRTVNVQRTALGGGGMEAGQMQRIRGELLRTWESTFEHNNKDHLLALIRLNNGETKLVDLGPEDRLDDLDLGRNDEISLVGKPVTIDGIPALCARSIEHEDEFVNIEPSGNVNDLRTEEGDTDRQMQRSGRVD